jgi:hypothetical protein
MNTSKRPVDMLFPERSQALTDRRCIGKPIGCGQSITVFKSILSEKEYAISGLCEACQDKVFGSEEE